MRPDPKRLSKEQMLADANGDDAGKHVNAKKTPGGEQPELFSLDQEGAIMPASAAVENEPVAANAAAHETASPAIEPEANAPVIPPLPQNKIIAAIIVKTKDSINEGAANNGVIATAKMVQVINLLLKNEGKSNKDNFLAIRKLLGTPEMRDFRQDLRDYSAKLIAVEDEEIKGVSINAAGRYYQENILSLKTPKITEEDADKYWPAFMHVITDNIADWLAQAAYRYGHAEVSADIKFGRLANEICSFGTAHGKGKPSDELRAAMEPFRIGLKKGSDSREIMEQAAKGGSAREVTDAGGNNAVSRGSLSLGHSYTKGRHNWLLIGTAGLLLVGTGLALLNKNIREKIFGEPQPAPLLLTPEVKPKEEAPQEAGPKQDEAPKAIPVDPSTLMKLPTPADEPAPQEVQPVPETKAQKPEVKMLHPKEEAKVWKFPLETSKKTPEYVAMRIKQAIADKLLPKYGQFEDANKVMTWVIEQFGGEKNNKLNMRWFEDPVVVWGVEKQHSELNGTDKSCLSLAFLNHKFYGCFLQDEVRADFDEAFKDLFIEMPSEIASGFAQLQTAYAAKAKAGSTLEAYLDTLARLPKMDSEGAEVNKVTEGQAAPIINLYQLPVRIHTADKGEVSRKWLDHYLVGGRNLAAA